MAPERPLRRDAERNRRRILDAAAVLVVERGLAVPLEDVAAAAEVGVGTLYRRFPDRDALVRALFAEHLEAVAAIADRALAEDGHGEGVERFLRDTLEHEAGERGLSQVLRGGELGPQLARDARRRITPVVERLVDRAHAAGTLPAAVGPADLVLVELMVGGVQHAGDVDEDTSWRRALDLALAGLRAATDPSDRVPDDAAVEGLQNRPRR